MALSYSYFCPCLNVYLRFRGENNTYDDNDRNHNVGSILEDSIFIDAPQGVTVNKKIDCLCRTKELNSWLITTCHNCGIETHATFISNGATKLCISRKMMIDSSDETRLTQLDNYSPVFQIVVQPFATNESTGSFDLFGIPHLLDEPTVGQQADELRHKTSRYVESEREKTMEKIRNFEAEQLLKLKETEFRALREQNILMQKLNNVNQKENILPSSSSVQQKKEIIEDNKASSKKSETSSMRSSTFDVFAMDEDDVFSQSDDESSDSQEDECPSDDAPKTTEVNNRLYATSLPISMPDAWKDSYTKNSVTKDDNPSIPSEKDTFKTDDPQWIAESIQAMAMSVCGTDGTEMFGARPRPRLNTLD